MDEKNFSKLKKSLNQAIATNLDSKEHVEDFLEMLEDDELDEDLLEAIKNNNDITLPWAT